MYRLVLLMLTAALAMPLASASAATFVDIDDESFLRTVRPGQTVSGTFDIVNPGSTCILGLCDQGGFSPGSQGIDSARVTFAFLNFGEVDYAIDLGSGAQQLLSPPSHSFFSTLHIEVGVLNQNALDDLSEDGLLGWALTNTADEYTYECAFGRYHCKKKKGDPFILKLAKLKAEASNPIPEPTSALLFAAGFGVVGSTLRRRQRSRS